MEILTIKTFLKTSVILVENIGDRLGNFIFEMHKRTTL